MWSWKVGRLAGIDIYLHPTLWLLLLFVGMSESAGMLSALLVAAVFGCVLLHELGHALAAQRFGIETKDITLYPIGGVARLARMPRAPGAELLIALAGPAVNLLIAGGLMLLPGLAGGSLGGQSGYEGPTTLTGAFLAQLATINLWLALFNLIPAFPMDGGRVLRAFLSGWLGRIRATDLAADLGQALALAFGMYSLLTGSFLHVLLAAFVFMAARAERNQVYAEEEYRRQEKAAADGMWVAPAGYRWVSRGPGLWQLAPIVVAQETERARSPWR